MEIVQAGSSALVVNPTSSSVTAISGRTWHATHTGQTAAFAVATASFAWQLGPDKGAAVRLDLRAEPPTADESATVIKDVAPWQVRASDDGTRYGMVVARVG